MNATNRRGIVFTSVLLAFSFHISEFGVIPVAQLTEPDSVGHILSWMQNDWGSLEQPHISTTPNLAVQPMAENQIQTERTYLWSYLTGVRPISSLRN